MEEPVPYEEKRPWGAFRRFILNTPATVKIISVKPGEGTSLQTHAKRSEFWRILSGGPVLTIGDVRCDTKEGDEFFVPQGSVHRIEGGEKGGDLLEISIGEFDEEDITRLEDDYGRS